LFSCACLKWPKQVSKEVQSISAAYIIQYIGVANTVNAPFLEQINLGERVVSCNLCARIFEQHNYGWGLQISLQGLEGNKFEPLIIQDLAVCTEDNSGK